MDRSLAGEEGGTGHPCSAGRGAVGGAGQAPTRHREQLAGAHSSPSAHVQALDASGMLSITSSISCGGAGVPVCQARFHHKALGQEERSITCSAAHHSKNM